VNVSSLRVDSAALCRQMGYSTANAHTQRQAALGMVAQPDLDAFFTVQINDHKQLVLRYAKRPLAQLKMTQCPSIVVVDCNDDTTNN
jgi:hypothetical protein